MNAYVPVYICSHQKRGARGGETPGRRGTESSRLPAREPRYQAQRVALPPDLSQGASNQGGTDMESDS
jgi:hypothetical protein